MRTYSAEYIAVETARQPQIAWLCHLFACRDGIVTLPAGWGSWCYSLGFAGNADFTDTRDYAGDGVQERTYAPAALDPDMNELAVIQDGTLDERTLKVGIDPALEPFAHYVNDTWPLRFGLVVYRVHRDPTTPNTVRLVDSGATVMSSIRWVGYLKSAKTVSADGKQQLQTEWACAHKVFERRGPVPVYSLRCHKKLFATGAIQLACNADKEFVKIDGAIAAISNNVIRATEWGAKATGWFANGLIEYVATDPISGLDFSFALDIVAHEKKQYEGVWYGDLTIEPPPPLLSVTDTVHAYGGCNRTRSACMTKHRPAGVDPAPSDGNLRNFGGAPDMPVHNPSLESKRRV